MMKLQLLGYLLFLILFERSFPTSAEVIAINTVINQTQSFEDAASSFGTSIGDDGLKGFLVLANPLEACERIDPRPVINVSLFDGVQATTIALIQRGHCDFGTKVYNAQQAKFDAVIVYNDESDALINMGSDSPVAQAIDIPSVFVGLSSGYFLKTHWLYNNNITKPYVTITKQHMTFDLSLYLIPFCTVVGTCIFCLLIFMSLRYVSNRRRQRRNRLSQQRLKQLPIKQFAKGDEYDVCAICLEEYEEGEKLRVLPCQHAYHCKCVDPWLTTSKRVCPLCKRRVLSDDESSNSEDDSDDDTSSEEVPLLRNSEAASPNASRYATGFSRINPFARSLSTSTEESVEQTSLRSTEGVSPNRPVPTIVDETRNTTTQQTPEFFSLQDNTPNPLVVVADIPPTDPELSSSIRSAESIEAYSCGSSSSSLESDSTNSDEDCSHVFVLRSGADNPTFVEADENATNA